MWYCTLYCTGQAFGYGNRVERDGWATSNTKVEAAMEPATRTRRLDL
jgi:hypothetical protein